MTDGAPPALKVGVALALTGDPGEMLADAKAVEAAGADSIWVFGRDIIIQYVLMSALAAVTSRVRLFAPQDLPIVADGPVNAAQATCARIAHGRLINDFEFIVSDAALDTAGIRFADAMKSDSKIERWVRVPFPDGRAAWDELRRACSDAGASGIVLPNDPRLIDLLRNPDIVEDRSDLKLSFG